MSCRGRAHSFLGRPRVLALLLEQLSYRSGPARLMARAHAGAVVAVEVLVEEHVVTPVRIVLEGRVAAEDGAPPVLIADEDADQPARQLIGDLVEGQVLAGSGRTLDLE